MSSKSQLVKYSHKKLKFEIITKSGTVLKYRANKLGYNRVLLIDQIFTNSVRGNIANTADLMKVFGTDNIEKCCRHILDKGELQLSSTERKAMLDSKTNEIVYYINKNYIDPKSKFPHTSLRILNCMKECKIRVNVNGEVRRQAEEIVSKMRGHLMFAKAIAIQAQLSISHAYVGKCMNIIKEYATVVKEEWTAEGCCFNIELSSGDMHKLQLALSKPTNGDYRFVFGDNAVGGGDGNTNKMNAKKNKNRKKKKKNQKYNKSMMNCNNNNISVDDGNTNNSKKSETDVNDEQNQNKRRKKKRKKNKKKRPAQDL